MHSYREADDVISFTTKVLILVLMEDALVPDTEMLEEEEDLVLILVLMEDALVRVVDRWKRVYPRVLILVLMEDALVRVED